MSWLAIRPLKLILLLVAVLYDYAIYAARLQQIDSTASLLAYVVLFSGLILVFILFANTGSLSLRLIFGLLLSLSWLFYDAYFRIMGDFISYDAFIQLYNSRGFALQTIVQYLQPLLFSLPPAMFILAAIILAPQKYALRKKPADYKPPVSERHFTGALPALSICALAVMLYMRGGDGANGLPQGFVIPAYASLMTFENITESLGPRAPVSLTHHADPRLPRDIVFIIDESIRGDYLDINNPNGAPTGLIPVIGETTQNFGYVSSPAWL